MRYIVIATTALFLAACDLPGKIIATNTTPLSHYVIADVATIVATDKTIADHIASYQTGKDCSTVRVEQGRTYCVEDEPNPQAEVYCYPSIGSVTCYEKPDPTRAASSALGRP